MCAGALARFARRSLSVPIYFKILGIGALVATSFAAIIVFQARESIFSLLYLQLRQNSLSSASALASDLERSLITGDQLAVEDKLRRARTENPDIQFVIVEDRKGRVIADNFEGEYTRDLLNALSQGLLFVASSPILDGHAGALRLGLSDRSVRREVSTLLGAIGWSLVLCACIGAGAALVLTRILTRPVDHLVEATRLLGNGRFDTRAEVFSDDEIGRLAGAFNTMAEALQAHRKELQEKELTRTALVRQTVQRMEDERRSISRELHDQLGQSLVALLLAVQTGCRDDGDGSRSVLQNLENQIQDLIDSVRRLAWNMRPSILDDYGLNMALDRYVEEVTNYSDIVIDYEHTESPGLARLPDQVEITLYRIAQEAITNVLRHASASQARVVLNRRHDAVSLMVGDDGKGFDPHVFEKTDDIHLGIIGMKERAALLGGTVIVESDYGSGTRIKVEISLNEEERNGNSDYSS
jgi:signal transduction histidine kinase